MSEPRRLVRIFKLMKGRGVHLQYSVFHCSLTWSKLSELKEKLNWIIDEKEDDVRIYPLPSEEKVIIMGCGDRVPDGVEVFLE
ncbi:MAG: CRISPR-associated endonuclease Cas2 [Thermodesulfovibrionales bacterium]|nr:CRISPR-associated endonuclease Cas2 [Thermodesulfovibrionales bacterium]